MFGDRNIHSFSVSFADPAADEDFPILAAKEFLTVVGASLIVPATISPGTADMFSVALYNGGTAPGTALTPVAGTVGGSVGFVAFVPTPFEITNGVLKAGEVLKLRYDETGTATIAGAVLQIDYVNGQGE